MVYECIGNMAETPYYLESACINIFSLEELAYFLYENALIVDASIMKKELCIFIDEELGLYDLAAESKQPPTLSEDLNRYIYQNLVIRDLLRYAMECQLCRKQHE